MPNMPTDVTVQPASVEVPVPPLSSTAVPAPTSALSASGVSDDTSDAPMNARSVLQIPSNAMSKIRKDERAKGAKAHQKRLDDEARAFGFESHAALIAFAQERKGRTGAPRSSTASPTAPTPAPRRALTPAAVPTVSVSTTPDEGGSRVGVRRATEIRSRDRQLAQERKKLRRAQHDLNAERASSILRIEALRAGITDVDYALHLAREAVRRIPPAKLKNFDERRFFAETLRTSHPHLFATPSAAPVPAKPVTTGPSGGEPAPSSPTSARTNGAPQQNGQPPTSPSGVRDYRTSTPEQVNNRLRELGLAPPGSSLPI